LSEARGLLIAELGSIMMPGMANDDVSVGIGVEEIHCGRRVLSPWLARARAARETTRGEGSWRSVSHPEGGGWSPREKGRDWHDFYFGISEETARFSESRRILLCKLADVSQRLWSPRTSSVLRALEPRRDRHASVRANWARVRCVGHRARGGCFPEWHEGRLQRRGF
jgi:hypothetical protein